MFSCAFIGVGNHFPMILLRGFEEKKSGDRISFCDEPLVANFSVPENVLKTITKFSKIYPENIISPFRICGVLFVSHSTSLFLSNVQSFIFWCYLHFNSTTWCHHSSAHCDFQLVRIHVFHDEILILLQSSSSSLNVFGDIFHVSMWIGNVSNFFGHRAARRTV